MACFCIGPFCVPWTAIWPLLIFFAKPLFKFFQTYFSGNKSESSNSGKASKANSNGECRSKQSDTKQGTCSCSASNLLDFSDDMDWNEVIDKNSFTLIKFTASWCKPCKRMEPAFLNISKLHPQVSFVSVDIDKFPNIAVDNGVTVIPHFQLYKGGKIIGKCVGESEQRLYELMKSCC